MDVSRAGRETSRADVRVRGRVLRAPRSKPGSSFALADAAGFGADGGGRAPPTQPGKPSPPSRVGPSAWCLGMAQAESSVTVVTATQ